MRIGLVRMRYTPYGGAEQFMERFISGLIERGHTLDVFATSWVERPGVTFHRVKASRIPFLRPLSFAMNAGNAVNKVKPDIVISLERTCCQDVYRAGDGCHSEWLARRGLRAGWVKRLSMALNPLHMTLLSLEMNLFKSERLKAVVANSRMVKADIVRHYGLPEEKIYVIYNGIDPTGIKDANGKARTEIRRELGVKDDTVLLLFVGSGFERKGLIFLVRALAELKYKGDVRLVVVGKGRPAKYLKEARRLGVSDRIIFKGPVKGALEFYQAGDIFVLPSIYEPFSNACLEAMAAGLPVVTTSANGASELITEGVNGAVVEDPADTAGLAGKIGLFLAPEARKEAGERARIEALMYPVERNVNEFMKLIDEVKNRAEA